MVGLAPSLVVMVERVLVLVMELVGEVEVELPAVLVLVQQHVVVVLLILLVVAFCFY